MDKLLVCWYLLSSVGVSLNKFQKHVNQKFLKRITMNHSSVKLNEEQVPGAKLTVDLEKRGKNEAVRW